MVLVPPSDHLPPGWQDLPDDMFGRAFWDQFDMRFGFQASTTPDRWPAIREPAPSMTLDLSPIFDGDAATFVAGVHAVNGLALLSMVEIYGADEQIIVLDWQPLHTFFGRTNSLQLITRGKGSSRSRTATTTSSSTPR